MGQKTLVMLGEPLEEIRDDGSIGISGDGVNFTVGASLLHRNIKALCNSDQEVFVKLMGAVGFSPRSSAIRVFVANRGVDESALIGIRGKEAGQYTINLVGEKKYSYSYADRDTAAFREWFTPAFDEERAQALATFDEDTTLVLSGITVSRVKNREDFARLQEFIEQARAKQVRIVFDENYRPPLWNDPQDRQFELGEDRETSGTDLARARIGAIARLADIVYLSYHDEATAIAGSNPDDSDLCFRGMTRDEVAKDLLKTAKQVVLKEGKKGCVLYEKARDIISKQAVPAVYTPPEQVVDTSGAGDTIMAGTEMALAHGATIKQALIAGTCAAHRIIKQAGGVLSPNNRPTIEEMQAYPPLPVSQRVADHEIGR